MTLVTYPSPIVPGPPPLTIEAPDEWEQVWAPETLFAIREPDTGQGTFLTNLVARYYHRGPQFGPEQAIEELRQNAVEKEGEVGQEFETEIDGKAFFGAAVSFKDPNVGTIVQLHVFTANPRGEVLDVLQLTGSCGPQNAAADVDLLRNIMKTLRINP
jgi:hypothetical protein